MPHYMFQASYTAESMKAMIANPQDRGPAATALIESMGGKVEAIYFCMGSDDIVAIIQAPDDMSVAALSMTIGGSGGFSAGRTTKLMTTADAMTAMQKAGAAAASYAAPGS